MLIQGKMGMAEIPDIARWAESPAGFYIAETRAPIRLCERQKEILRHVLTPNGNGRLRYETILYSCPKKSGKTTLGALVAEYVGLFFEPPNEVFCVANDFDQSQGRVFKDLAESVRLNPHLAGRAEVQSRMITFDNGTTVTALPSDYAGAAGSNHGLVVWDELWAYTTESARRLWDELTPVPTRRNSIRFIATYAGFEGESRLLWELYQRGQGGDPVPQLCHLEDGADGNACRKNGRLFMYWDHVLRPHPGLTVDPETYHAEQRAALRPSAFRRMHLNEWAASEEQFVSLADFDACISPEVRRGGADPRETVLFAGVDAGIKHDSSAVVLCYFARQTGKITLHDHRIWKPSPGKPIDLQATIGDYLSTQRARYAWGGTYYDPYQLHSLMTGSGMRLLRPVEFPQTPANQAVMTSALFNAVVEQRLALYPCPDLREHVQNAVAVETPRGVRLAKERTSRKIDAAVALSMAVLAVLERDHYLGLWQRERAQRAMRPAPVEEAAGPISLRVSARYRNGALGVAYNAGQTIRVSEEMADFLRRDAPDIFTAVN